MRRSSRGLLRQARVALERLIPEEASQSGSPQITSAPEPVSLRLLDSVRHDYRQVISQPFSVRGRPSGTPGGVWHGIATKAEEYDVISVDAGLVVLEGYDAGGFVANSAYVEGAVLCSGTLLALWSIRDFEEVTADSLALLLLMKPAPDLLILGCGESIQRLDPRLQDWLAENGISVECLDTANAVSTFNILNQEGRKVAAALLPSP